MFGNVNLKNKLFQHSTFDRKIICPGVKSCDGFVRFTYEL